MAKLFLKHDNEIIADYDLDIMPESFSAGSAGDNDIVISDAKVNLNHLQFQRVENGYTVRDVWSGFGTFLNGNQLVKTEMLHHGDCLEIGFHTLVFDEEDIQKKHDEEIKSKLKEVAAEEKHQNDLEFGPYDDVEYQEETRDTTTDESTLQRMVPKSRFCLLAISGPYLGNRYFIDKDEIRLGRDPQLDDLVIQKSPVDNTDSSISPTYATLLLRNNRCYFIYKGSDFYTTVNQRKVVKNEELILLPSDEIKIASRRKSHVFRLVECDNWDFSPPKKAGSWWLRYGRFVWLGLSLLIAVLCLIIAIRSFSMRSLELYQPDQLQTAGKQWLGTEEPAETIPIELDEAGFAYSPPMALSDLNRDGIPDVLYVNAKGQIAAISGHEKIPVWPTIQETLLQPRSIAFADMNRDNMTDILAINSDSRLLVFDGSRGTLMNKSPTFAGMLVGRPAVADINGDRELDITIVGRDGKLHIGISQGWDKKWESVRFYGESQVGPSASDIDRDGAKEVIIGSDEGIIHIYSYKNKEFTKININERLRRAKGELYAEQNSLRCPILASPISGNRMGMFIATLEHNLIVFEIGRDKRKTKRVWFSELMPSGRQYPTYHASPVIIDLDGDHKLEFILASHNGAIMAFANDPVPGRALPSWMFSPESSQEEAFIAEPAFADINKDGVLDVIVAGLLGRLYALNGTDGSPLLDIPLSGYPFSAPPVIGDVDGDNQLDILLIDDKRDIYVVTTNVIVQRGSILWSGSFISSSDYTLPHRPGYYMRISLVFIFLMVLVILPHIILWLRRKRLSIPYR